MAGYFSNFPTIKYNDIFVKNITIRTKIIDFFYNDPYSFLPYTIIENQKPEDVAYYYYGSTDYVWLVILSNKILDPFFEWPLSENNFFKSISKKYRDKAIESTNNKDITDYEIYYWTMSSKTTDNILYYYNENKDLNMSVDTYKFTSKEDREGYIPMRIYDEELKNNEKNQNIYLLNKQYLNIAEQNLQDLLND